ncbi:hypothetical protein XACM_1242 [Xanthomonas euvesicatoria pv. citrumelo F1]|nr:hypothetical protein XACM_1242 [Xanthomonas euvesicatoria pv. citrumelo F1]
MQLRHARHAVASKHGLTRAGRGIRLPRSRPIYCDWSWDRARLE